MIYVVAFYFAILSAFAMLKPEYTCIWIFSGMLTFPLMVIGSICSRDEED